MNPIDWKGLAKRLWRIPAIAALGGMLAFVASFLIPPTYEASTRLLVRGRATTLLSSTGEQLGNQAGVVDATLAKALGETQSALLASRRVAEMVVDDLELDRERPKRGGIMGALRNGFAAIYKRTRAYLAHGFYAEPEPRQNAIESVYAGLSAKPLKESYVIELTASADNPELAAAIANSAASALVTVSEERFRQEAAAYRDFLKEQIDRAATEQATAAEAVRKYKSDNGITDVNLALQLSTTTAAELRDQLRETDVELRAKRAELASVDRSLRNTEPTDSNVSEIETGRSTTRIENKTQSSVYNDLRSRRESLRAEVAALEARRGALRAALNRGSSAGLTEEEATLRQLELQVQVATDTYEVLAERYQQAVVNSEKDAVEITPVDTASAPLYPAKPARYLYLFMGGLVGAMVAFAIAWRAGDLAGILPVAVARPVPVLGGGDADDLGARDLESRTWTWPDEGPRRQLAGRFEVFRGDLRREE